MKYLKQCVRKQNYEVCKSCPCYTCEKDSCSRCNGNSSNYMNLLCPFEIEHPELIDEKNNEFEYNVKCKYCGHHIPGKEMEKHLSDFHKRRIKEGKYKY